MKRQRAFSLIEMILVVVIIGLLATLVLPKFLGWGERGRKAAASAQVSSLKTSLQHFHLACGRRPTTEEGLEALVTRPAGLDEDVKWEKTLDGAVPADPWGRDYIYRCPGTVNTDGFDLFSLGLDGVEGTDDDIGNTKP